MLFKLMLIFFFIVLFFNLRSFIRLNRKKKVFKPRKLITFNKKNLNNWMNLTKKERYNFSKEESIKYLVKRKLLLEEIRKEYKKISKENPEKNIKEK